MLRSCLPNIRTSFKSPLGIYLGEFIMKVKQMLTHCLFRLPMKYLLVREFSLLCNWQNRAMDMWTFLIEMRIKANNIILTPLLTCEAVLVKSPLFHFRHTLDMGIISLAVKIHILSAKSQFHHAVMVALKYYLCQRVSGRALLTLIWVFQAKYSKTLCHALKDGLRFVDRLYLTAFDNLKVQVVTSRVILTPAHLNLLRMVTPFTLVFVALIHGHPLSWLDVHDLF